MIKFQKYFYGLLILIIAFSELHAQHPRFYSNIQQFKSQDSVSFPPKQAILFVGSSSFTRWTDVKDYFPDFTIINRGFGGSSLRDLIRYTNDIIFPYSPRQIVIYCGENDLPVSNKVTADTVYSRFKQLFQLIRTKLPDVPIAYISMKPSPKKEPVLQNMSKANTLIRRFLKKKKKTAFIDIYHKMINEDGKPMKSLFIKDNLHMNADGYKIWQKIIEPYLIK